MSPTKPLHGYIKVSFIAVSILALAAIVFSNVIRVGISERAATGIWAATSVLSWFLAIAWAVSARHRASVVWLSALLTAGVMIAVCQHFAGGLSRLMMLQLLGSAGAGLGLAVALKESLKPGRSSWIAAVAALFGSVAAIWMALEPGLELWKLLPNHWEISKDLQYRWGIRYGQDRARFLFDTPMEAGVVQWFLGTICLALAVSRRLMFSRRWILGVAALLLYGTVALTYSRAGIALGILSIGLAGLCSIRTKRTAVLALLIGCAIAIGAALVSGLLGGRDSAGVRNVTSIVDPAEEANHIRITQFAEVRSFLADTPWHGKGPDTYATFKQAPRMPEHESFPIGLVAAFGIGGVALILIWAWALVSNGEGFLDVIVKKRIAQPSAINLLTVMTVLPFSIYSLVAPILASLVFGFIWFTVFGMLVVCEPTLEAATGKQ